MRSLWLLTILSVTALAQPSNKVSEPEARFEGLVHQFDYNNRAPSDIREEHREERDGATVVDPSYASPRGGRVPAFLVVPFGHGPFAAVLFGHWMMPGSPFRSR